MRLPAFLYAGSHLEKMVKINEDYRKQKILEELIKRVSKEIPEVNEVWYRSPDDLCAYPTYIFVTPKINITVERAFHEIRTQFCEKENYPAGFIQFFRRSNGERQIYQKA